MPISLEDLVFAATLPELSKRTSCLRGTRKSRPTDEHRIMLVESAATRRFGLSTWHHRYAHRFPTQKRYRLPRRSSRCREYRCRVLPNVRSNQTPAPAPNRCLCRCHVQRHVDELSAGLRAKALRARLYAAAISDQDASHKLREYC